MTSTGEPDPEKTADFGHQELPSLQARAYVHMTVDCAAESHRGLVRQSNEDQYHVTRFGRFLEPILSSIPPERRAGLLAEEGYGMIVADGMGGAKAGEVASELAIQTLTQLVRETPDWILSNEWTHLERVSERMAERFQHIHRTLSDHAKENPQLEGMGTTMTVAVNFGGWLIVAHVGDSRAYLYRDGKLHRLTRDHTIAQEMMDSGIARLREELPKRWRHALTRALGGGGNGLEGVDVDFLPLQDNDKILVCTDGLNGMVTDDVIASVVGSAPSPKEACRGLVDAALQAGGKDNVTVIVAAFRVVPASC